MVGNIVLENLINILPFQIAPNNRRVRSKRDAVEYMNEGKFHSFRIRPNNQSDYIYNINIKVPEDIEFPYASTTTPFPFFLPLFKSEVVIFREYDEIFMVTELTRCRYRCSKDTNRCGVMECWDRPSACFGDFDKCQAYDGEGTCKNMANSNPRPNKKTNEFYEMTSIDFRRILRIGNQRVFVNELGGAENDEEATHFWRCVLEGKRKVYCFISSSVVGWSVQALKTLSGYDG